MCEITQVKNGSFGCSNLRELATMGFDDKLTEMSCSTIQLST